MEKKEFSNVWLHWFKGTKSINGMRQEIEGLDRLIWMEKSYPYKGEDTYKMMIRKKILLQAKIRLLEEGVVK